MQWVFGDNLKSHLAVNHFFGEACTNQSVSFLKQSEVFQIYSESQFQWISDKNIFKIIQFLKAIKPQYAYAVKRFFSFSILNFLSIQENCNVDLEVLQVC